MSADFDLAILGSGFSGALLAMVARRLGLSVLLLERGAHPRFAIGESTSPLTNLLLEELAREYQLPRLLPLCAYGAWKETYPEIGVGLKRGFTFYKHEAGNAFVPDRLRRNELMVAASPNNEVADTHWYRADFDHFLVREAQSLGAEHLDRVQINRFEPGVPATLSGIREGRDVSYRARFTVDASGPRGALARMLDLPESRPHPTYRSTQALFSHFTGVRRFETVISRQEAPPYPPDDAALHHVFHGGWIWVLRFENGVTSAGIAAEDWLAEELGFADGAAAWDRVLARFPSVRAHFEGSEAILPFIHARRLGYRCDTAHGPGFALLPSAAGFVDPLFSTGFPLTLLGIHRLGKALREHGAAIPERLLEGYAHCTGRELADAAFLVDASYAAFPRFESFVHFSMHYFAAASFAEMARRLDRGDLASQFLLGQNAGFRDALRKHGGVALGRGRVDAGQVAADLEPFNIAGLCAPEKRNWYGVDLQDVIQGAEKLQQTPEAIRALLTRMGLAT
ncbi:MAG: NAD(P)/FAD-dependent oxidoreductase [Actinomycetota bacterium]